jgi:dTDP-4-amino-4,6-dideoxygalactose transaminase
MKAKNIPLMVPDIQQQDIDAVVDVLKSGMLIQGRIVETLEFQLAKYLKVDFAIATSSGTSTLHLALLALGIGKGDEVIVPALSFVATANVVELVGATPVFVDIELNTSNIDVNVLEQKITTNTKAIIPVHEFGMACNIVEIMKFSKKHNIAVIEDAACALGAKLNNDFAGTFGDFGSFSFHPRKAITSGEGGLLVTNSETLANRIRTLRNHGFSLINCNNCLIEAGFNYRMTDIQAALVLSQFQRFETILSAKHQLAQLYLKKLANLDLILPFVQPNSIHTWQSFHVVLPQRIDRNRVIQKFKELGVGVNLGAQCIPNEYYYKEKYKLDCHKFFPNALLANTNGLVLPLYERLSEDDILHICDLLKEMLDE